LVVVVDEHAVAVERQERSVFCEDRRETAVLPDAQQLELVTRQAAALGNDRNGRCSVKTDERRPSSLTPSNSNLSRGSAGETRMRPSSSKEMKPRSKSLSASPILQPARCRRSPAARGWSVKPRLVNWDLP
jgi:hypothetical protein